MPNSFLTPSQITRHSLKKGSSDKTRSANIAKEAKTKPIRQAVAIAYAVQREAKKKGK